MSELTVKTLLKSVHI